MSYNPRWYQEEAVDGLFDYFANHGGTGNDGRPIPANPVICLPTGTGKSLVIGLFLMRAFGLYPRTRAMVLTHVKELISQNASKLLEIWPLAPLGVYSAGLNARDMIQPIIFGGIKSCVGKGAQFGFRDFLIIDEAHLIPGEGDSADYLKFIGEMLLINPYLKIIMLTATPYRMGLGLLTNGKIATDIAYDLTNIDGFNRLLAEGYLAPLIPKKTRVEVDTADVGMTKGEFNAGQLETAAERITYEALQEAVEYGANRHSWLIFASGVKHADYIGELLNGAFGIPTAVIHSKRTAAQNSAALAAWKAGECRAAVNMNSLTTGVDHPPADFCVMLRPTMSTGLWVQMLGRLTRPYDFRTERNRAVADAFPYVKANGLVLDFAGNTRRLGPINDPVIPRQRGKGPPGDAPVRICPSCGVYNHASSRVCIACGVEFPASVGFGKSADTAELLRSDLPMIEPFTVDRAVLTAHVSRHSGRASIKVAYYCGYRTFYEYVSFETAGVWFKISRDWFRQRYGEPWEGMTNAQVLNMSSMMRHPRIINVWINKQTPQVMSYEF
jgi:DNA repair protein RadD